MLPTALMLSALVSTDVGSTHEMGWVCVQTPGAAVAAIAITDPTHYSGERRIERDRLSDTRLGHHLCAPVIVELGTDELPADAAVFERDAHPSPPDLEQGPPEPSTVELQVIPADADLMPWVIRLDSAHGEWLSGPEGDAFVTTMATIFPLAKGPVFPQTTATPDPHGEVPRRLAKKLLAVRRFAEPCGPVIASSTLTLTPALASPDDGLVDPDPAPGRKSLTVEPGTAMIHCRDTSRDPGLMAIALPFDAKRLDRGARWFLLPQHEHFFARAPGLERTQTTRAHPFGGYSVCHEPTWETWLYEDVDSHDEWRPDEGTFRRAAPQILPRGTPVTALAFDAGLALVQVTDGDAERFLLVRESALALPRRRSAPLSYEVPLGTGCARSRGEWRRLLATAGALPTTPATNRSAPWVHLAAGTQVLMTCDDPGHTIASERAPCSPVPGAELRSMSTGSTGKLVRVRYAGRDLLVHERTVYPESLGSFSQREDRPPLWLFTNALRETPGTARFYLGSHGTVGVASGVSADARIIDIDAGWTFDGALGAGADEVGGLLHVTAGARRPFAQLAPNLEAFGGVAGRVDVYVTHGGGLGLQVVGKLGLRYDNDLAPVLIELGVSAGYGDTFDGGRGGWRAGLAMGLGVEVVRF